MRLDVYSPRERYPGRPMLSPLDIRNMFADFERDFNKRWTKFDTLFDEVNAYIRKHPEQVTVVKNEPLQAQELRKELTSIRKQIEELKAVVIPKVITLNGERTKVSLSVISKL